MTGKVQPVEMSLEFMNHGSARFKKNHSRACTMWQIQLKNMFACDRFHTVRNLTDYLADFVYSRCMGMHWWNVVIWWHANLSTQNIIKVFIRTTFWSWRIRYKLIADTLLASITENRFTKHHTSCIYSIFTHYANKQFSMPSSTIFSI